MEEGDGFQNAIDEIVAFLADQGHPVIPEFAVFGEMVAENCRDTTPRNDEENRDGKDQLHVNVNSHQSINRILNKNTLLISVTI